MKEKQCDSMSVVYWKWRVPELSAFLKSLKDTGIRWTLFGLLQGWWWSDRIGLNKFLTVIVAQIIVQRTCPNYWFNAFSKEMTDSVVKRQKGTTLVCAVFGILEGFALASRGEFSGWLHFADHKFTLRQTFNHWRVCLKIEDLCFAGRKNCGQSCCSCAFKEPHFTEGWVGKIHFSFSIPICNQP